MKIRLTSIGLAVALTVGTAISACSDDNSPGSPPPSNDAGDSGNGDGGSAVTAADVVKNYAKIVHENYEESVAQAKKLQAAVDAFLAGPSEETLAAARKAWTEARPSYGQTEAFRFYGGPIDADNTGPEGEINGWPLDEAYIDYVIGKDPNDPNKEIILEGGIINTSTSEAITKESIAAKNEQGGEANISTGWHAIEFLLWGQDRSTTGPGNRPYTDYLTTGGTNHNQQRRRDYLKAAVDLLVDDLESVEVQWHTDTADTYASKFIAGDQNTAIRNILNGIGSLAKKELANERMNNAYQTKDQEEEHSCFSDTTLQDLTANAKGIENVYLGRYGNVDGAGIDDLVKAKNPALDAEVKQNIAASLSAIAAIPAPFDQAILSDEGHTKIKAAIDSVDKAAESLVSAATALGLQINLE
ncbi:iron-regulated protein [Pendulispora brunnea]|uniref:Iron-regulated protein n=1 Tax=Pendulispora brunnea TaxID=2905690 RepID=A0ABZ2KJH5_9BACT